MGEDLNKIKFYLDREESYLDKKKSQNSWLVLSLFI